MPDGLLLLLQGRRRRSAGRGHGLVKGRRGIGTLLAACIVDVSTRYKAMTATARGGSTGHTALGGDRNVAGQVVEGQRVQVGVGEGHSPANEAAGEEK